MNKLKDIGPDALMIAGACAIAGGAWMLHPAAGLIMGGLFCLVGGLVWAGSAK